MNKSGSTSRHINLPGATGIFTMTGSAATPTLALLEDALLSKAQELITKGDTNDFRLAVVVAHMACEVSAERAILQAFAKKRIEYRDDNYSNFNLANSRSCNLYNAITGREIHKESFWTSFKKSTSLRNNVIHKAKPVTRSEAKASLVATTSLVAYLK